ncbi:TetR/AcrR family transcriptional regulator [Paenibacillus sp. FA6]|uniref:TetR/AcrR family transcriptional regulator n=1 Tax=Paenibacillus sp. FA6 TaxID=3413029 RepID=UPI003F66001C
MSGKSNSRETIVDTATRLFFTQGYHATGLNQIIKESESPKGSLYYYFPDGKEELVSECIERTRVLVLQKLNDCFTNESNAATAIQAFILSVGEDAVQFEFEGLIPFGFWMSVETSCISEKLRVTCQSVFKDWEDLIAKKLQEEEMDMVKSSEVASIVISLLEGALIITLTKRDKSPLVTASKYVTHFIQSAKVL